MARRPTEVVVFDTEFTAWQGSMERGWSGPGEHKEIVQIGAVLLDARTLAERRLALYHGPWAGSVEPAFTDCVLPM